MLFLQKNSYSCAFLDVCKFTPDVFERAHKA